VPARTGGCPIAPKTKKATRFFEWLSCVAGSGRCRSVAAPRCSHSSFLASFAAMALGKSNRILSIDIPLKSLHEISRRFKSFRIANAYFSVLQFVDRLDLPSAEDSHSFPIKFLSDELTEFGIDGAQDLVVWV
jgi:hypothetical protein